MKKLALLLLAINGLVAQTLVQQTLINPSGRPQSGQVTITNPSFTTATGTVVSAGTTTYAITNGLLSIRLYPTVGAVPTGTLYSVTLLLGAGGPSQLTYELWNVPDSDTPVSRASVIVSSSNPSAQTISLSQIMVSGAVDQQVATWSNAQQQWIPQTPSGGGGGGMIYPGAGIAVSTGSAWTTSLSAPTGTIVGTSDTQTLTNKSISGAEINSGTVPSAQLPLGSDSTPGAMTCDGVTITCDAGVLVSVGGGDGSIASGPLSSLPGTCTTGALYFVTDQPAGQQLYTCSSTNTWTQVVNLGGSGALQFTNGALDINTVVVPRLGEANTYTGLGTFTGGLTANSITDSSLTNGQCVQAGSSGLLTTTGSACGSGSGNASLSATGQSWTGAGSLTLTNGALIFPIGQNAPIASAVTASGTVGGHAVGGGLFQLNVDPQSYTGTDTTLIDDQMSLGYNRCMNGTSCISSEPAWFMGWEHNYCVPSNSCTTNLFNEWYMQFQPTPNGASRPIFVQVHRDPTCIAAQNCIINDFELNSDPVIGIGFHDWSANGSLWAKINATNFTINGNSSQSGLSLIQCTGLNSQGCEFNFTNGTVGYRGYPVTSTIWEFDMLGVSNWMQYNNTKTSLGGAAAYLGNATFTVEAASGTNVAVSIGLNSSNTADLLRLYGNTGSQLGQISSAGLLTLPNITATSAIIAANVTDSALTSGQCVQAGTGGILSTTGSACGSGGSGNTTSTSLVSGNLAVASGANAIVDSGVGAASGVLTASDIKSNSTSPLLIDSTSSTGGISFRNNSATGVAFMNNSGHLTAGSASDLAGTGAALYSNGDLQTAAGGVHKWAGRAVIASPADGQLEMINNSQNGFNYLCWSLCSTGSGFRLNNNSGVAQFQNAAGSADATIEALNLNIVQLPTNKTGSSGSCNFIEPFQGAYYKRVIAICSGLNGTTATYTFLTPFTNAPGYFISGDSTAGLSATVTSTTVTITAITSSSAGTISFEGY